jgi:uncharacterized protein (DUF1778 family)
MVLRKRGIMAKQKHYTKRAMVLMSSVRLPTTDIALLREAAAQEGISQSEFVRRAIKEQATRALLDGREERPE